MDEHLFIVISISSERLYRFAPEPTRQQVQNFSTVSLTALKIVNKTAVRYQSETAELPLVARSGDRHALPGRNSKGMVKWDWSNILDPTLETGISGIRNQEMFICPKNT